MNSSAVFPHCLSLQQPAAQPSYLIYSISIWAVLKGCPHCVMVIHQKKTSP